MGLVFTASAEMDLEAIGDYIALDNPTRALTFIQEIRKRCELIVASPRGAPLYEGLPDGLRQISFGRYLIFYKQVDTDIVVIRVLHAAQDVPNQLGEGD